MDPTVKLIEDLTDRALGRSSITPAIIATSDRTELFRHLSSASQNADVDALPQPPGRGRALKQAVLKGGRFTLGRQRSVNHAFVGVTHEVLGQVDALAAQIDQERHRAAGAAAFTETALANGSKRMLERIDELQLGLSDRVDSTERRLTDTIRLWEERLAELPSVDAAQEAARTAVDESVRAAVDASIQASIDLALEPVMAELDLQRRRVADLEADLVLERHRREILDRELRSARASMHASTAPADPAAVPPEDLSVLSELYDRFEQHFRPVGQALTDRFTDYVADLEHLAGGPLEVLDIGTGRGDFLKVLDAAAIPARGVDTNRDAVERATADGLRVDCIDAFELLGSLSNESVGAVTAFHVVEHLAPGELLDLVDEAVRVLAPGGLLIFETPNPTNLVVGAATFYHDPTHRRPLTPDYLAFVLRDRGLVDVQTRFLHPLPEYDLELGVDDGRRAGERALGALLKDVQWALKGPMDFAVVGRSPAAS